MKITGWPKTGNMKSDDDRSPSVMAKPLAYRLLLENHVYVVRPLGSVMCKTSRTRGATSPLKKCPLWGARTTIPSHVLMASCRRVKSWQVRAGKVHYTLSQYPCCSRNVRLTRKGNISPKIYLFHC